MLGDDYYHWLPRKGDTGDDRYLLPDDDFERLVASGCPGPELAIIDSRYSPIRSLSLGFRVPFQPGLDGDEYQDDVTDQFSPLGSANNWRYGQRGTVIRRAKEQIYHIYYFEGRTPHFAFTNPVRDLSSTPHNPIPLSDQIPQGVYFDEDTLDIEAEHAFVTDIEIFELRKAIATSWFRVGSTFNWGAVDDGFDLFEPVGRLSSPSSNTAKFNRGLLDLEVLCLSGQSELITYVQAVTDDFWLVSAPHHTLAWHDNYSFTEEETVYEADMLVEAAVKFDVSGWTNRTAVWFQAFGQKWIVYDTPDTRVQDAGDAALTIQSVNQCREVYQQRDCVTYPPCFGPDSDVGSPIEQPRDGYWTAGRTSAGSVSGIPYRSGFHGWQIQQVTLPNTLSCTAFDDTSLGLIVTPTSAKHAVLMPEYWRYNPDYAFTEMGATFRHLRLGYQADEGLLNGVGIKACSGDITEQDGRRIIYGTLNVEIPEEDRLKLSYPSGVHPQDSNADGKQYFGLPGFSVDGAPVNLTTGVYLDLADKKIKGTPLWKGTFPLEIITNGGTVFPCKAERLFWLVVDCPSIDVLPDYALANATCGTAYNVAILAAGGNPPYTGRLVGRLPAGMSYTGNLTGTPRQPGIFHFRIEVTDEDGCVGVQNYRLAVNCPSATVNPSNPVLPGGTVGSPYSVTFSAASTPTPRTFLKLSGTIPPGLTLNTNGVLNGTPTRAGFYAFAVVVKDGNGCANFRDYQLTIL